MKRSLLAAAAILALGTAAEAQSIGGTYDVQGTTANGGRYQGVAVIEATSNTTCRIVWRTPDASEGICMRMNNVFTAAYRFQNGPVGLAIYEILPNGAMRGTWTISGRSGAGTENLTPR